MPTTKHPIHTSKLRIAIFITIFATISVFGISFITGNQQQGGVGNSNASALEPADINNDNTVNVLDLSFILGKWKTTDTTADLNTDGIVNVLDLSRLLSKWGPVGAQTTGQCPGEPNTPGGEDKWGGCWPGPHNTGVPRGLPGDTRTPVTLTPYTGLCSINTDNVVIDSMEVNCDRLRITANNVVIKNSRINGRIDTPSPEDPQYSFDFTLTDSEVAVGDLLGEKAVKLGNMVLTRANITGTTNSVTCTANCTVVDSWMHDQATDPEGIMHVSGIRQGNGGLYRHNSIICEAARGQGAGGACSGAITGYGDLVVVQNNLIERNLILAGTSSICVYGGSGNGRIYADLANNIRFIDNVFGRGESGRCGTYALVAAWNPSLPGNVWSGNTYLEDGAPAIPE